MSSTHSHPSPKLRDLKQKGTQITIQIKPTNKLVDTQRLGARLFFSSSVSLRASAMESSSNADYAKQEYWDQRYEQEDAYDWFGSVYDDCVRAAFDSVEAVYEGQRAARETAAAAPLTVLHLGIGNSNLCADLTRLYRERYPDPDSVPYTLVQVAVDYSPVVIGNMARRSAALADVHWVVADVRDLAAVRAAHGPCFDLVIDKATMDAFQASEGDDVEDVARMLREVSLCLGEGEGEAGGPSRFRRFTQMTWEVPYYRLYHTTRHDDHSYVWGANATHRFLGDSDMYRLYCYDVPSV